MTPALDRFLAFVDPDSAEPAALTLLAHTPHLESRDAEIYAQQVPLCPLPQSLGHESRTWAIIRAHEGMYVLARAEAQTQGYLLEGVLLPVEALLPLQGDLEPLLALLSGPLLLPQDDSPLAALALVDEVSGWTSERELQTLRRGLAQTDGDFMRLLALLGWSLHGEGVAVFGHAQGKRQPSERLALVQALRLLLPPPQRANLTFCTHANRLPPHRPRLAFCDRVMETSRTVLIWGETWPSLPDSSPFTAYLAHLASLWQGDLHAFLQERRQLDDLAGNQPSNTHLAQDLARLVERHRLDQAVLDGTAQDAEAIIRALDSLTPAHQSWRQRYYECLLKLTLQQRRADWSLYIARAMDADPQLHLALMACLEKAEDDQPDAVYSFVRARLLESPQFGDAELPWLVRLHHAAERALSLAILHSDAQELLAWFNLIVREPPRFDLGDILCAALSASARRAHHPQEGHLLAAELLALAVRRCPSLVDDFLSDRVLVANLPPQVAQALIEQQTAAIEALAEQSRELFLLTLSRALQLAKPCLSGAAVRSLWEFERLSAQANLPPDFQPSQIALRLAARPACLLDDGLEALLAWPLRHEADALFRALATRLKSHEQLERLIFSALEQSQRPPQDVVQLLSELVSDGTINSQQAADIDIAILTNHEWPMSDLSLIEHLARLLSQHSDIQLTPSALWHMVEMASILKNEAMGKAALRRLLADLPTQAGEVQLVRDLARLRKLTQWSAALRNLLAQWWRETIRQYNTGQLQKLERALDSQKSLEDFEAIVRTALAMRRVLGQRRLADWAEEIDSAFRLLQALTSAFDPEDGDPIDLDTPTVYAELEAHSDGLSPEVRHVMATNLRGLAALVARMAERRSKPSLIRSEDALERQLMSGEQSPQSALDFMKWASGYLDGLQKPTDSA
ncbi:MAG: hypothetical protein NZ750_02970 [Anaerolineae bacterium]|nr:hypothetical protein [Anaerolineae bacterium]MDW8173358.1 hypothetical protein [Anaerolineae bacterium]